MTQYPMSAGYWMPAPKTVWKKDLSIRQNKAVCIICNCISFNISNMGMLALVWQKVCKKHKERDSINWISSLFHVMVLTSTASSFVDIVEVDKSLLESETSISVPADSMNKLNVSKFLSTMLATHNTEIIWAPKRFFYSVFHADYIPV